MKDGPPVRVPESSKLPETRIETILKTDSLVLMTGAANPILAKRVGAHLQKIIGEPITVFEPVKRFADGEAEVAISESVRKKHLAIIHPTSPPTDASLIELAFMMDAARQASVSEMTVAIPYYGYSRQDRQTKPRQSIAARVVAQIIEQGKPDGIILVDIHSQQEQGFFRVPVVNLSAAPVLIPEILKTISEKDIVDTVVVSPDKGGISLAQRINKKLGKNRLPIAVVNKERDPNIPDKTKAMDISGEVLGHPVLLVDDILGTGGSLLNAAQLCLDQGAVRVDAVATHALWADDAYQKLLSSNVIRNFYVTDTVQQPDAVVNNSRVVVASIAGLLAEAIKRIHKGESVGDLNA